jgi:hypothetical protein
MSARVVCEIHKGELMQNRELAGAGQLLITVNSLV